MTRRRKIIIGVIVAGVVIMLLPVWAHYRAKAALADFKRQLQAQGEKLAIEELIPPPPTNGPNGAFALVGAASRLARSYNEHSPRAMKYISPGHAVVAWKQETFPMKDGVTNPWPQLRLEVEVNRESMNEAKIALANPVIDFNLDYRQGFMMKWPDLGSIRGPAKSFAAATLLELHEGHADAAWENLRATMAVTRCLAEEPMIISQLIRIAMLGIAFNFSWEALQFPGWRDEQLSELQAAWHATRPLQSMSACLAMERVLGGDMYEHCRQAPDKISLFTGAFGGGSSSLAQMGQDFVKNPKAGLEDLAGKIHARWIWPLWTSYPDEIWYLRCQQAILTGARLAEKNYAFVPTLKLMNQNLAEIGPAEPQFAVGGVLEPGDISSSFLQKFATAEIMRQLTVTAIALKRHQLRHGKYPAELLALVPEFLPTVPLDFMDGKPLRYRPLPDGQFLLYSVGIDGEDNVGDASPPKDKVRPHWFDGRDWVWPLPASPAEIEADNAKQQKKQRR